MRIRCSLNYACSDNYNIYSITTTTVIDEEDALIIKNSLDWKRIVLRVIIYSLTTHYVAASCIIQIAAQRQAISRSRLARNGYIWLLLLNNNDARKMQTKCLTGRRFQLGEKYSKMLWCWWCGNRKTELNANIS